MSDVAEGLARFLSETWQEPVRVEAVRVASAGARRRNLLFEATRGELREALAATIMPTPEIAHTTMEVEAALLRTAEAAGVPAPRLVAVTEDPAYVGGPLLVTRRVEGESIPRRILRLCEQDPTLGSRLASQCGEAMARLHAVPQASLDSRIEVPASGDAAAHALRDLEEKNDALLQPSPALTLALVWLARNLPAPPPAGLALVHGDWRNGNIAVSPKGLEAAYDWEIAHVGDPMEDLAWICVRSWRFRNDHLEVGGFATRESLFEGYRGAGGSIDLERFRWWKLLRTVWWGLGLADQAASHLDGSFPSIVMAASGRRVAELEYDVLMLLSHEYEPPHTKG